MDNPNAKHAYFRKGDTLRLEERLTLNWSGVTTCGDDARIKYIYQQEFSDWSKTTKSVIDSLSYLNSSYISGKSNSNQNKEPWRDNSRNCTGSGSIDCWIEFIKK